MGILDDAIREHLELKRSHGASDDEIKRKEAEVFGAARQEATPAAPPEEHTQLMSPDDHLEPAPEDPYAVHPGDDLVADPDAGAPHTDLVADPDAALAHEPEALHPGDDVAHDHDVSPAAEAGAGMLEPHEIEPGPPIAPDHRRDEQHPALVDHDEIGSEEHAPEPVFGHAAETPTAPPDAPLDPAPVDDPPVGDPPVENPEIDEPPPRQSPEQATSDEDEDVLEETPEFLQDAPEHDRLWFEQKPPRDFDFGE
jgi:hypothetical protein